MDRLRFKDENGKEFPKWEFRKIKHLLNYEQPTKYLENDYSTDFTEGIPVLTANKTFILGNTANTNNIYKETPCIIFDDFTTLSKYVDFQFKVKSSAIKILKLKDENYNLKLIYEKFKRLSFLPAVHKRHYISEFQSMKIEIPTSIIEQEKIGGFLRAFDRLIQKEENNIEKYESMKKGYSQRLFYSG